MARSLPIERSAMLALAAIAGLYLSGMLVCRCR